MATLKQRNDKRMEVLDEIRQFFEDKGVDIDYCAKGDSNTAILNFPTMLGEEEGWVEVSVSVPTKKGYDGLEKREDYWFAQEEKRKKEEQKQKERENKKKKKKEEEQDVL